MKFEEIYTHMAAEYKTLAGVEPEDAADVSIRLKVLAGELYTAVSYTHLPPDGARGRERRGGLCTDLRRRRTGP